jgi:hypothetical protein
MRARALAPWLAAIPAALALSAACKQEFDLASPPYVSILPVQDDDAGVQGKVSQFMSTALQPADWQNGFFANNPQNKATLDALRPRHVLVQLIDGGAIPLVGPVNQDNPSARTAADWNFDELNRILYYVLQAADQDPMIQIAVAPSVSGMTDSSGQIALNVPGMTDASGQMALAPFAEYCKNLVAYYNEGGFDWGADHIARPSNWPAKKIAYWGILSDINAQRNSMQGTPLALQYAKLYGQVTTAMQGATNTPLHFSALEFNLFAGSNNGALANPGGDASVLQQFLQATDASINDVAVHFFGTSSGPTATDTSVLQSVRDFSASVAGIRSELLMDRGDSAPPVWVTENNVQADVPDDMGMSMNNVGHSFSNDSRGTSPFFAAWRPLGFSRLAKAGSSALYHWDFTAGHCTVDADSHCAMSNGTLLNIDLDTQNAEVDFSTGDPFLSYWVDSWLGQLFPPDPPLTILQTGPYDASSLEILATRNEETKKVVVMVVDVAVQNTSDNNGAGVPQTVVVDVSQLGSIASASRLTIDAETHASTGPGQPQSIPPAPRMVVTLHGYGVAFLILQLQ